MRLVLGGTSAVKVAKKFGDAPRTVAKWVERYRDSGIAGLEDGKRPGRPSSLNSAQEKQLKTFVAKAYADSEKVSGGILGGFIRDKFGVTLTRRQCERILKGLHEPKVKYFAYGSNMLTQRLQARVSSAEKPLHYVLPRYALHFNKKSTDGSGKCNIVKSASNDDTVHGLVFDISEIQLGALDSAEGKGKGYDREILPLEIAGSSRDVFVYLAEPSYIDDALLPYDWYHALVVAGAEQHDLPTEYVARLKSVQCKADPRPSRDSRLEALAILAEYARSKEKR